MNFGETPIARASWRCRTARGESPALRSAILGLILTVLAPLNGPAHAQTGDVHRWSSPLEGPRVLTSTFGEYRGGHFHSGVDLSTGQRVGVPVRAVDDGEIVRLRASAHGYGRALYLRTESGLLAVYAHLLRFSPRIEVLLREHQRKQGEYETDLHLGQGLPVHRGELLGWSGDSGAGPPHFHLELREGDEPLNPLLEGFEAPDPDPPQIRRVRFTALSPESRVEGSPEKTLEVSNANPISPIELWGDIGITCQIVDRAGPGSGRLAPLEVTSHVRRADGSMTLLARRRFDRVSYSWTKQVARVYDASRPGETPEIRLFVWPGSNPDPTWRVDELGLLRAENIPVGVHEILVEATDAAGHSSLVSIPFVARQPSEWVTLLNPRDGSQRIFGEWVGAPGVLPADLQARGPEGSSFTVRASRATPGGRWWSLGWSRDHPNPERSWQLLDLRAKDVTSAAARGVWGPWDEAEPRGEISWESSPAGLVVWLDLERPPISTPRLRLLHAGGGRRRLFAPGRDGRWWCMVTPSDLAMLALPPTGAPPDQHGDGKPSAWRDGASAEVAWGPPGGEGLHLSLESLSLVRPEASGSWSVPGTTWSFAWTESSVYGEGVLRARVDTGTAGDVQWTTGELFPRVSLPRVGPVVDVSPFEFPLRSPFILSLKESWQLQAADTALGLYRRTQNGWRWVGDLDGGVGGVLHAPLDQLGTYTILRDTSAPWILGPEPGDGEVLTHPPTRLRVMVGDAGSGFRPQDADILLDGRSTLARYDPDTSELLWEIEDLPGLGPHTWEVRVVDRAGLSSSRTFSFLVKGP